MAWGWGVLEKVDLLVMRLMFYAWLKVGSTEIVGGGQPYLCPIEFASYKATSVNQVFVRFLTEMQFP